MRHFTAWVVATVSACTLSAAFLATPAQAEVSSRYNPNDKWGNVYAGLSGDLTWLRHSDLGGGGNVALGVRFWPSDWGDFRLEGEVGYHSAGNKNSSGNTHYFTYMGNLYYDLNHWNPLSGTSWNLVPYVGAGIGDATVHFGNRGFFNNTTHEFANFSRHDNVFAYQFMAGLNFVPPMMPNTDWFIGYRFLGSDSKSFLDRAGNRGSDSLSVNNVELGVRFHF